MLQFFYVTRHTIYVPLLWELVKSWKISNLMFECLMTHRQTYRQTNRQTDRQTNRQTDRHADINHFTVRSTNNLETFGDFTCSLSLTLRRTLSPSVVLRPKISQKVTQRLLSANSSLSDRSVISWDQRSDWLIGRLPSPKLIQTCQSILRARNRTIWCD